MNEFPLSSCCNFPFRLIWQDPRKPFEKEQADAELCPFCMEELSSIFLHVQRTVCCHQKKRTGEEQGHVHILVLRAESGASVPQARSFTPTDIHVCFDIICSLLLLCLYWTKTLKPLKFFCTCNCQWILSNIQCLFISAWVHSLLCSPFRWAGSTQPWKSCWGYWSEFPP